MEILWILLIVAAIVAIWAISTVNGFKRKEIKVEEARSGIEVALTKRYDMLTKLLDTAKGYMAHEKDTLETVIKMRRGMSVDELQQACKQMDAVASSIQVTAEAYPELRSSEVFSQLQRGIWDAEEHLQAARRVYNANVSAYNTAIAMAPASLLAGGRQSKAFFEAEQHKREDVKISF